ncbi:MAG: Omp28 family outer membrane lipoprotein [Paludibacter sp.]|jgi:hypothetical protein|nr:Omp28 family outer membrane lipoprotein [Paludibacter sp.]
MKLRHRHTLPTLLIALCTLGFVACDIIPADGRIEEMEEIIPQKKVLLLDFTDQDCINCLQAAAELEKLKGYYGDDLIPVSIHASLRRFPLRTLEGNEYEAHFLGADPVHPTGVIDGLATTFNFIQWGGLILERFNKASSLDIDLYADCDNVSRTLTVRSDITGLRNIDKAKLLLWIIEDKVIDFQLISTGVYDYEYLHRHVFRSSVNGTWGEEFSIKNEEKKQLTYNYTLNESWKSENISIIAFVYNPDSNEVFDVAEINLNNE